VIPFEFRQNLYSAKKLESLDYSLVESLDYSLVKTARVCFCWNYTTTWQTESLQLLRWAEMMCSKQKMITNWTAVKDLIHSSLHLFLLTVNPAIRQLLSLSLSSLVWRWVKVRLWLIRCWYAIGTDRSSNCCQRLIACQLNTTQLSNRHQLSLLLDAEVTMKPTDMSL